MVDWLSVSLSTFPLDPSPHSLGCGTGVENLQTSPGTVRGAGQSTRHVPFLVKTCLLCSKGAGKRAQVLTAPQ